MSFPGFGIGMINDDFHIAEIGHVVAERLKRFVMYSMALGPRCFKWKMLSLSGPKALLFLQLLIAFITRSVVNVRTISNGFLLVSLVTTLVSLEEVCLPIFEVLNCWLNLVAKYKMVDKENESPLKVIASFSASRFALSSIPLIVLYSLVTSVFWSMVSTKSLFLPFLHTDAVLDGFIQSWQFRCGLFYGGHLVCSPRPVSLLVQLPHEVCGIQ